LIEYEAGERAELRTRLDAKLVDQAAAYPPVDL
jgi:hypothetical protein